MKESLTEKYRPRSMSQVRGQHESTLALESFLRDPYSTAFVFSGPTGVGKTAAARALAIDLGCDESFPEMGGLHEVPSGKQDGSAVESLLGSLRLRPMLGSGWRVAVINEADYMTRQAEVIWLDALEALPSRCVVVFTTNDLMKLSQRLVGRCECLRFSGHPDDIGSELEDFIRDIWHKETGQTLALFPENLGRFDLFSGTLSFRLALQQIAPYVRARKPLPARFDCPMMRDERESVSLESARSSNRSAAAHKAVATRRQRGK